MSTTRYRNVWGSQGSNLDQQRGDLFRVAINLPAVLGGVSKWNDVIQFAVTKFPFPERSRETIATKYLNQTNFQLGADAAMGTIDIPVRYAFNQETAKILEQWHWMTSHPGTGAVALTSAIKTSGYFYYLIPNLTGLPGAINAAPAQDAMKDGATYALEGILLKGLKNSEADMESSNNLVMVTMTLQIDRYYPVDPGDLQVGNATINSAAGLVASELATRG